MPSLHTRERAVSIPENREFLVL